MPKAGGAAKAYKLGPRKGRKRILEGIDTQQARVGKGQGGLAWLHGVAVAARGLSVKQPPREC